MNDPNFPDTRLECVHVERKITQDLPRVNAIQKCHEPSPAAAQHT